MDTRILSWLEQGYLLETLLGEGEFFIRDHTWGDHDYLLVMGTIRQWIKPERVEETGNTFLAAIKLHCAHSRIAEAISLYDSYQTAFDKISPLKVRLEEVELAIADGIRNASHLLARDEVLRNRCLDFLNRYPHLKSRAGLL